MEPDWKDAPRWAKWLAMESDGTWYWYNKEPSLGNHGWICDEKCRVELVDHKSFAETLKKRPQPLELGAK